MLGGVTEIYNTATTKIIKHSLELYFSMIYYYYCISLKICKAILISMV